MKFASKARILPTRGRDDFNSYLHLPFILSLPNLQVLVRSYELASAVFLDNNFESKLQMKRKYALLLIKIDGLNHCQIEQTARSYFLLVRSGHLYLTRITVARIQQNRRVYFCCYLSLYKKNQILCVFTEGSLVVRK